jgi:hypothetical protein
VCRHIGVDKKLEWRGLGRSRVHAEINHGVTIVELFAPQYEGRGSVTFQPRRSRLESMPSLRGQSCNAIGTGVRALAFTR